MPARRGPGTATRSGRCAASLGGGTAQARAAARNGTHGYDFQQQRGVALSLDYADKPHKGLMDLMKGPGGYRHPGLMHLRLGLTGTDGPGTAAA